MDLYRNKIYCEIYGLVQEQNILWYIWTCTGTEYIVIYMDLYRNKIYCEIYGLVQEQNIL